jgi:hypothetical protein
MLERLRRFLCAKKLHAWTFVGWAEYGRGRLERCSRMCGAVRTVKVSSEVIEQVLRDEVRKVSNRRKLCDVCYSQMVASRCPECDGLQ